MPRKPKTKKLNFDQIKARLGKAYAEMPTVREANAIGVDIDGHVLECR